MAKKKQTLKQAIIKAAIIADAAWLSLIVFAFLAIDSGSYWHYIGAIISIVVAIKFTKKSINLYGQYRKAK